MRVERLSCLSSPVLQPGSPQTSVLLVVAYEAHEAQGDGPLPLALGDCFGPWRVAFVNAHVRGAERVVEVGLGPDGDGVKVGVNVEGLAADVELDGLVRLLRLGPDPAARER